MAPKPRRGDSKSRKLYPNGGARGGGKGLTDNLSLSILQAEATRHDEGMCACMTVHAGWSACVCTYVYSMYMYMYMYMCMCMCMCNSIYMYTHVYVDVHVYVYIHIHLPTCIHTYIHACMHACMHAYIHVCVCLYVRMNAK